MRAHPLEEMRSCADLMLTELRKVVPAFFTRVDQPDRGGRWSAYFADVREKTSEVMSRLTAGVTPEPRDEVHLAEFDPEGEVKVVAAALYASSSLPDDQLLAIAAG
jgi:thymidylate synthase ThyX